MSSVNDSQWMYVQCKECQKKFETDIDVKAHFERFHEFGESFRIYPCELCGFSGDDVPSIKNHMEEHNRDVSLELLRIIQLPEITNRRKHNFEDIVKDNESNIDVADEEDDE